MRRKKYMEKRCEETGGSLQDDFKVKKETCKTHSQKNPNPKPFDPFEIQSTINQINIQ